MISYATFQAIGSSLPVHLAPPKPYKSARAANRGLRAIGAVELLPCVLYGVVLLFASLSALADPIGVRL